MHRQFVERPTENCTKIAGVPSQKNFRPCESAEKYWAVFGGGKYRWPVDSQDIVKQDQPAPQVVPLVTRRSWERHQVVQNFGDNIRRSDQDPIVGWRQAEDFMGCALG